MKFEIKETGKIENLRTYNESGVDWTEDLIGNSGAIGGNGYIHYDEEKNVYVISQSNYGWWNDYIVNMEQQEKEIKALRGECDYEQNEKINQIITDEWDSDGNDYDNHSIIRCRIISRVKEEIIK